MAVETDPFDQLRGIVELDKTYLSGESKDRYGRTRNKKPHAERTDMVLGIRERGEKGGKPGRVKFVYIKDGKAKTIRASTLCHLPLASSLTMPRSKAMDRFSMTVAAMLK